MWIIACIHEWLFLCTWISCMFIFSAFPATQNYKKDYPTSLQRWRITTEEKLKSTINNCVVINFSLLCTQHTVINKLYNYHYWYKSKGWALGHAPSITVASKKISAHCLVQWPGCFSLTTWWRLLSSPTLLFLEVESQLYLLWELQRLPNAYSFICGHWYTFRNLFENIPKDSVAWNLSKYNSREGVESYQKMPVFMLLAIDQLLISSLASAYSTFV